MKSISEAELLASFASEGTDRYELQERFAATLGIKKVMGTVEEADVIVGGAWPTPMRGAQRFQCDTCNQHVSLAPSSQAALTKRARHIICMRCAMSGKADKLEREGKPDA